MIDSTGHSMSPSSGFPRVLLSPYPPLLFGSSVELDHQQYQAPLGLVRRLARERLRSAIIFVYCISIKGGKQCFNTSNLAHGVIKCGGKYVLQITIELCKWSIRVICGIMLWSLSWSPEASSFAVALHRLVSSTFLPRFAL